MKITTYHYEVPYTIALLSDLHNRPFEAIIKQTSDLRPDIIGITGDVINGHRYKDKRLIVEQQDYVLPFLRACAQTAPTFFSYGNHEWMLSHEDERMIAKSGVVILNNTFVKFGKMYIGGLTSGRKTCYERTYPIRECYHKNTEKNFPPDITWLNDFERLDGYKLLLCHHPEYRDQYLSGLNIDLVLSGHCHGGQIRIFDRGLFAPGQGWLPKQTKGVFGNMIISAGLSNTGGVVPRLFNPREIVLIKP